MGKTAKDKRDIYYRLAKEEGWRARSAFKLMQIDDTFNIFEGVTRVVDLCAAPGSWSQVVSKRIYLKEQSEEERSKVKIVAVDLQPMSPLPGVIELQGDITELSTAKAIIDQFDGAKAELVICDGAPDVTGLHAFDEYLQSQLVFSAFNIGSHLLENGGSFVSKIFRARNVTLLYSQMKIFFKEVYCCKPRSSRLSSCEAFIICKYYSPPDGYVPNLKNPMLVSNYEKEISEYDDINRLLVPYMACGDMSGFDSDRTYPLDLSRLPSELTKLDQYKYEFKTVVQPPTDPCYKKACELKVESNLLTEQCDDVEFEIGFSDDEYDLEGDFQDLSLTETPMDRVGQPDINKLLESFSGTIFVSDDEEEYDKQFKTNDFINDLNNLDDNPVEDEFLIETLSNAYLNK